MLYLLLLVALAGCGSSAPSPAADSVAARTPGAGASIPAATHAGPSSAVANPSDVATFARIEGQVEQLRGLSPKSPVTPVLLDSRALADELTRINADQTNHVAVAAEGRLLIHLGLLPEGSDLEQLELALESEQVVGFYDPASKGLYVLSTGGGVGATEKATFSHEYTHALQDQNFGIDKLALDTADQGDRDLARTALPEGDATLLMSLWSSKYLSAFELIQMAGESVGGSQSGQLASAPRILRETLVFPYQDGLSFVESVYRTGGWLAVNALYDNPPDSTSQILHPELYAAHVEPLAITVPAVPASLAGWTQTMQDTLGELQLRIWLESDGASSGSQAPASAVSSWAGDRVGLYEGPDGQWVVLLHTAWRAAAGRDDFQQAATAALSTLGRPNRICGEPGRVDIAIGSSDSVLPAFLDCNTMG
jgi:hypothetical protein